MSGMGSFYVGASGLQTSQNALNTTGQNLANVSTEGYVRQLVLQSDRRYNTIRNGAVSSQQVGLGTTVAQVYQCRDYFLDQSYRLEAGRESYYNTTYNSFYEIETLFGETEGVEFSDSLSNLKAALDELAKTPDDSTIQTNLKKQAIEFVDAAKAVYEGLSSYQSSLNGQVVDTVGQINGLAQTISSLNKKITSIESGGQENANDLRDQRNAALDKLSSLIKISYSETTNGSVTVKAEGAPLVTEDMVYSMSYTIDDVTGFATPIWSDFGDAKVYDLSQPISSDTDTDVGKLKALLVQRGEDKGYYTDLPQKSDYTNSNGAWLRNTTGWTINGNTYYYGKEAYQAATDYYNTYTSQSSITNTMAQFDTLVNGIISSINDFLSPNTKITLPSGTTLYSEDGTSTIPGGSVITVLDQENCPQGATGSVGTELFSRIGINRYSVWTDGAGTKYYVYNEENKLQPRSLYTAANLEVNNVIQKDVSELPVYQADGAVDYNLAASVVNAWKNGFSTLTPDSTITYNYLDYYTAFIGNLANEESTIHSLTETAGATVNSIDNSRQQVLGVSSDEELSNMIRFQNAYNASSRYINVINEMLDTVLQSMGA